MGGGSAAHAVAIQASKLHATVTINGGLPQGGCCVNVGCVTPKFLIRAVKWNSNKHKYGELVKQKNGLLTDLRQAKVCITMIVRFTASSNFLTSGYVNVHVVCERFESIKRSQLCRRRGTIIGDLQKQ